MKSKRRARVIPRLVEVYTQDDLLLDGILLSAGHNLSPTATAKIQADGILCIHGNGDYNLRRGIFDQMADYACSNGLSVLRVNTRGNGVVSNITTRSGNRMIGSAYDRLSESHLDIEAWLAWAESHLGWRSPVLVGYSFGAIKCLNYVRRSNARTVARVVAISPPRVSYSAMLRSRFEEQFIRKYEEALELCKRGDDSTLLQLNYPAKFLISAGSLLERYAMDEPYNACRWLTEIEVPTLIIIGSLEAGESMVFEGWFEELSKQVQTASNISLQMIPEANHFYRNCREKVCEVIFSWLFGLEAWRSNAG